MKHQAQKFVAYTHFLFEIFLQSKLQRRDVATGIAYVGHSFRFLIYKHTENVVKL